MTKETIHYLFREKMIKNKPYQNSKPLHKNEILLYHLIF